MRCYHCGKAWEFVDCPAYPEAVPMNGDVERQLPDSNRAAFSVPLVPPSVNNYVRHTRAGLHYRTAEAKAWDAAVAICAQGQRVRGESYLVCISIYLGKDDSGDLDNFAKCAIDSIVKAAVICTDARVTELRLRKSRSWENPRTEIEVIAT